MNGCKISNPTIEELLKVLGVETREGPYGLLQARNPLGVWVDVHKNNTREPNEVTSVIFPYYLFEKLPPDIQERRDD
jgi:hypothetical protein